MNIRAAEQHYLDSRHGLSPFGGTVHYCVFCDEEVTDKQKWDGKATEDLNGDWAHEDCELKDAKENPCAK